MVRNSFNIRLLKYFKTQPYVIVNTQNNRRNLATNSRHRQSLCLKRLTDKYIERQAHSSPCYRDRTVTGFEFTGVLTDWPTEFVCKHLHALITGNVMWLSPIIISLCVLTNINTSADGCVLDKQTFCGCYMLNPPSQPLAIYTPVEQ